MDRFSDDLLIKKLKSTVYTDNDKAMHYLYQTMYKKVVYFIQKNSGTQQDTDDVFQDALIALYKLAKADRLQNVVNIQAYFFSICRNLWYKTLKKNQRTTELTEEYNSLPEDAIPILQTIVSEEKRQLLNQLLSSIGESCRQILIYYYYERLKMKEIMKLMNFSSEQVAKNKKSACMKKLKQIVRDNPGLEALLK